MILKNTEKIINRYIEEGLLENTALRIGRNDRVLAEIYKSENGRVNSETLFDMASVTKILSVTMLTLMAMDEGRISIDDKLSLFYDYEGPLTIRHLLTHTTGFGHKNLCVDGVTYDNIGEHILSIPPDIAVGSDVRYSCPAFILMGKILEKLYSKPLNLLFDERIAGPLGMKHSSFLPDADKSRFINSNINKEDLGKVNDYNCRFLGGVAGNAGIFSCIDDLTKFIEMLSFEGAPLVSKRIWQEATKNHTPDMSESRGLGFLYVDKRYMQTGELFAEGSIGHCGHTGQSVFLDPESGLYVIILSDATISTVKKYGKEKYELVMEMRNQLHNAIKKDLSL